MREMILNPTLHSMFHDVIDHIFPFTKYFGQVLATLTYVLWTVFVIIILLFTHPQINRCSLIDFFFLSLLFSPLLNYFHIAGWLPAR